jgi:hypothetical protein
MICEYYFKHDTIFARLRRLSTAFETDGVRPQLNPSG